MIDFKITVQDDPVLLGLIQQLEDELSARYGLAQLTYQAYNELPTDSITVLMFREDEPIGCAALKPISQEQGVAELKRMFIVPLQRGKRYGYKLLDAIEKIAKTLGLETIRLETGVRQPEALQLYLNYGFSRIPPFGPYVDMAESICMEKRLNKN